MGALRVIDVMMDVAYALIEQPVDTTVNPFGGAILPGIQAVTPGSMLAIYTGATLVAGFGLASEEVITVISVTVGTFTANFTKAHAATEPLVAPTFPSGSPDHSLFGIDEMLGYLADVQLEFLLKVRPIYVVGTAAMAANIPTYANPADAIRIERIALAGTDLMNVAQTDVDWLDAGNERAATSPRYWYQDGINLSYGLSPSPQRNDTVELFYSQKSGSTVQLLDSLFVPDCMAFIVKWGVLARALSKEGEGRDLQRAAFAQRWFDLFCIISSKFLDGVQGRIKRDEDTVEPMLGKMGI